MASPPSGETAARHWIFLITEQRRYPQMSYKSDIVVISGLDQGDMKAIDLHYKHVDVTCQLDKEDGRFVLKGPAFNPIEILNVLTEQRGYKIEYNPQQHGIPLKQGNLDDKFALLYHLSKAKAKKCCSDTSSEKSAKGTTKSDPVPPPRTDSLPNQDEGEKLQSQMSKVDLT